jgi:hypothetical protein
VVDPSAGHRRLILQPLLTVLGHACEGGVHPGLGWMREVLGLTTAGWQGQVDLVGGARHHPHASGDLQGGMGETPMATGAPGKATAALLAPCLPQMCSSCNLWTICFAALFNVNM